MTNGWDDPNGSERLLCNFAGDGKIITNTFAGWIAEAAGPTVTEGVWTPGTSDFSIEFWYKKYQEGHPDNAWGFYSFVDQATSGVATPGWVVGSSVRMRFGSTAADIGVAYPPTNVWTHIALNFDRSANMEILYNGVSQGTDDISAAVATSLTAADFRVPSVRSLTDSGVPDRSIGLYGPVATHNRLLTANEIKTSTDFRCVNDFGSSVTVLRYDWNVEEETGWEERSDHGSSGFTGLLNSGLADPVTYVSPTGVNGAVVVRDHSGNNRHWYPPVRTAYGTTFADWFEVAFSIDRTFER